MIVSCNVRECKHNDGNGFCNHEKELLIINYSDDGEKMPVCVDFEEDEGAEKNDCDFCGGNTEWEDTDNGFFMELRLDPPWHELHINLGYDTPCENDIVIELNYCPKCGRKLADEKR